VNLPSADALGRRPLHAYRSADWTRSLAGERRALAGWSSPYAVPLLRRSDRRRLPSLVNIPAPLGAPGLLHPRPAPAKLARHAKRHWGARLAAVPGLDGQGCMEDVVVFSEQLGGTAR
jgi:hypothetical protein